MKRSRTDSDRSSAARPAEDVAWMRETLAKHEGPLIQYASRLLFGDVDRARDVVQDTFLKLWTVDRASVDGHLNQWLYRVCRNRALDVRRKEVRMTTLTDPQSSGIECPPQAVFSPSHSHDSGDHQRMLEALNELPERQQEVIRLKFQGGLSYREIANVMDLTVTHVGVLIHNGLKAVRERLGGGQVPVPEAELGGGAR